ncbi:MAG TPA: hypothetical protein VIG08_06880 [Gemmatimonadales bacterium]
MTYLFKLVRRLAISRGPCMLAVLAVAGCDGETTAPDSNATGPTTTNAVSLAISPRSVTIETGQQVQFRGLSASLEGRKVATHLEWRSSGGSMRPDGSFSSARTGIFTIFGRGRGWKQTDTAVVRVVRPTPGVTRIVVSPDPVTIAAGTSYAFSATASLKDGSPAKLGLRWSATGGTVDPAGVYTADSVDGTYFVIAANRTGTVADTATVTVGHTDTPIVGPVPTPVPPTPVPTPGPTPVPLPTPTPTPSRTRVIVTPASASLSAGGSQRFRAYGRTASGDSVAVNAVFRATGGSITLNGLYTAGERSGAFRVIATLGQSADTSAVSLIGGGSPPLPTPTPAPPPIGPPLKMGVPFGSFGLLSNAGANQAAANLSIDGYSSGTIVSRLAQARTKGMHVLMNMTGGDHKNYISDGHFDMARWQAKMNSYNTPTIRAAIAQAVADGTIIGNSVMDEPQNTTPGKAWGPAGYMTKAKVDEMCRYVKSIFPTMPVGVVHDHRVLEPEKNYAICDFIVSQYRLAKAPIAEFRDGGVAFARRSHISIAFSLNILHGGTPGTSCAKYGDDPRGVLCPMSPEQIKSWGTMLGTAGCALTMWRYEQGFIAKPENQSAFRSVAESLSRLPRRGCTRT